MGMNAVYESVHFRLTTVLRLIYSMPCSMKTSEINNMLFFFVLNNIFFHAFTNTM